MTYKGYEISAELKTWEFWAVDDDGSPDALIGRDDVSPVEDGDIFYRIKNPKNGWVDDGYYGYFEEAKSRIDELPVLEAV